MLVTWGSSSGLNALLASSSLSLNFSNGSYTLGGVPYAIASVPGYSFTRASGGYAQNVDGSLTYFASGTPRITNKGYLSEEARTNLVTYSQDLTNAIWAKNAVTALANQTTAPDGTVTASSITETTATAQHYANYATSKAASAITYSTSVYVKPFGLTRNLKIGLFDGAGNGVDTIINPVTLATVSGPTYYGALPFTSVSVTTSTASNGFVRIGLIFTSNVTPSVGFGFQTAIGTTLSFAGDASTGFYVWGAQLEAGAFATSYIPTTTAAATRAADALTFTSINTSTWFNSAQGTLCSTYQYDWANSANTLGKVIVFLPIAAGSYAALNATGGANTGWFANGKSPGIAISGATNKQNITYTVPNNFSASLNGATTVTSSSSDFVGTSTSMPIGFRNNDQWINGYVKNITYYRTAFTDAQLQATTT